MTTRTRCPLAASLVLSALGIALLAPGLVAEDEPISAVAGTVVRWVAADTESCSADDRSWLPHGDTCYFPIDLDRSGELAIHRRRNGAQESATVKLGDYPYRVQHLRVSDDGQVNLSEANLTRAGEERAQIDALWDRDTGREFEIPLAHPIKDPRPGTSFGSKRVFNGQPRSPHSGEDYKASTGTTVLAAAAGEVVLAEEHFFGGNSVFIDHGDGLISMYMHLSRIDVEAGEKVEGGKAIGRVGSTGRVTGPHLHFGLRWRGARIDPAVLMPPAD